MRSRAFRPTSDKIVRLELHPTQPWLATADASDNVVVWDWEHRQVVYELNAGGVDARRLVGAKLQKLAEGEAEPKAKIAEAIRGGGVKQIKFYDEDVRFWDSWLNRSAAAEAPVAVNQQFAPAGGGLQAIRGRHFLVICCENKIIFLDMVTMRSRDVPKQFLENKSPLCMEFVSRGEGPLVGFGGSDGVIRVLSISSWQVVRKYVGGHKGSIFCLRTFVSSSGETLLVSGGSDGLLAIWTAENMQDSREISPKQTIKAHDGGVYAIELARVLGGAPQLVTIGADKSLAVWDTVSFKELRRIKPAKVACCSVVPWCHPRAPALDVLTCVKDSHIWAVQHSTYSATTRLLCDLSSHVPPSLLAANKKLKCYCMAVHPLQPHLVATGTNIGVILSEFDRKAIPAAVALPTPPGSKEHTAAFVVEKEIRLLSFQLSTPFNLPAGASGTVAEPVRLRHESLEASLQVKQTKKPVGSVPYDAYSWLSVSKSGKHVAVVCPEVPHFTVFRVSDWSIIDSGSARYFAWDTCKERYALLETNMPPRLPQLTKGKKAKEAAAQAAAAAAAAATAAASATVQARIILEDGSANQLTRAIEGRSEPVIGLQGGALLGVAYKFPRRMSFSNAAAASAVQASSFSGVLPTFASMDDASGRGETPSNFQLYSWETFKPVGGLRPQPEWTSWDQTVEYCAFGYPQYVVVSSLRPQFRYLGNVAIAESTGGVWHRRQLFLATATTIECVFVDAGINALDLERKRKKEETKLKDSQAKSVSEHRELALITVETSKVVVQEKVSLRPPMLQVVRLASFQHAPTIPPIMALPKQPKIEIEEPGVPKDVEDRRSAAEVAVAGGGVSVAISRLPPEQKRPVGPLLVVGVRDGVLWLIDRYMTAHAIGLGHPGIRCRCLAAHGDAISAVKWAARLGREHHDDLAQFMLGMGYATEALHLPGISKRLEWELALQSNDLKRALQCLLTLSNSRNIGQDPDGPSDTIGILNLPLADANVGDSVQGIIKYAKEFLEVIDAADATGQTQIASQALRRLAAAGAVKGALLTSELRGLALRLASHGELTRLGVLVNTMIAAGHGREAALGAALLGDSALLEKSWEETGMNAEAALHAQAHGRPAFKKLLQTWNETLEKDLKMSSVKASAAFSQVAGQPTTDDIVLRELTETKRKPLVEIVPPGNVILSSTNTLTPSKPNAMKQAHPQAGQQPLLLEGSPAIGPPPEGSQLPTLTEGAAATSAIGSVPIPTPMLPTPTTPTSATMENQHDPVLAALSQPAINPIVPVLAASSQPAINPIVPPVGNAPSPPLDLQPIPSGIPLIQQASLDLHQLTAANVIPAVASSSTPLSTTIPTSPPVFQQPLADTSQPASNPQDLSTLSFPQVAAPAGIVSLVPAFESTPQVVIADTKVTEPVAHHPKIAGPSVAALVDFFS